MTATGKTYPDEPSWCRLKEHQSTVGRHFSEELRIGDRRRGGEAAAWLKRAGSGPTHVVIFAGHMTSTSADLSLAEAALFRDHLSRLLELAGHESAPTTKRGAPQAVKPEVPLFYVRRRPACCGAVVRVRR